MRIVTLLLGIALIWATTPCFAQIPHVVSTLPAQNGLNVPTDVSISAVFDVDIDESSLNGALWVHGNLAGRRDGSITYDPVTKKATLDPSQDFVSGEVVTAVLNTNVRSTGGEPLEHDHVWTFVVRAAYGPGTLVLNTVYGSYYPTSVVAANFNTPYDDDIDLACGTDDAMHNYIFTYMNWGDGTFGDEFSQYWEVGAPAPHRVCVLDEGDEIMHIAAATKGTYGVSLMANDGMGWFEFAWHESYPLNHRPMSICAAPLVGGDGLDIVTANYFVDSIAIIQDTSPFSIFFFPAGDRPHSVCTADVDGDWDLDIMIVAGLFNEIVGLRNNGDDTFDPFPDTVQYPTDLGEICAGDLDGDGDVDLAVTCTTDDCVWVLLNSGDGIFIPGPSYPVGGDVPRFVCMFDAEGDGDLDIATANEGSDDISLLMNGGDGTFILHSTYSAGDFPTGICAADFDGDGDLDLACALMFESTDGGVAVFFNQCSGLSAVMPITQTGIPVLFESDSELLAIMTFQSEDLDSVSVTACMGAYPPDCGEGQNLLYRYYSITPYPPDATFEVTMTLFYEQSEFDASGMESEKDIGLFRYDESGGTWVFVPGEGGIVDTVGNSVTFGGITELSLWSLGPSGSLFLRSDADADMDVEMSDAIFTLKYLYVPGSPQPPCMDAADSDDGGSIEMSDAIFTLKHLYVPGSPPPPAPFPDCGVDPTADELECEGHPCMGGRS